MLLKILYASNPRSYPMVSKKYIKSYFGLHLFPHPSSSFPEGLSLKNFILRCIQNIPDSYKRRPISSLSHMCLIIKLEEPPLSSNRPIFNKLKYEKICLSIKSPCTTGSLYLGAIPLAANQTPINKLIKYK